MIPPCSNLSRCCFSQHRSAENVFGLCCSKRNNNHVQMFMQFGIIAGATSLKCKNKQLKLLLKRRKVNLWGVRWSIFTLKSRLKINVEAVLEHLPLKNFLRWPIMVGYRFTHLMFNLLIFNWNNLDSLVLPLTEGPTVLDICFCSWSNNSK